MDQLSKNPKEIITYAILALDTVGILYIINEIQGIKDDVKTMKMVVSQAAKLSQENFKRTTNFIRFKEHIVASEKKNNNKMKQIVQVIEDHEDYNDSLEEHLQLINEILSDLGKKVPDFENGENNKTKKKKNKKKSILKSNKNLSKILDEDEEDDDDDGFDIDSIMDEVNKSRNIF